MGRWTLRYTDEVLVTRVENIINGAIKKAREDNDEKAKLLISYESFVEGLDEEDSFTSTLIEILFKELSDRRSRTNPADKQFIAQCTVDNLQHLARSATMYHVAPFNRIRNRSNPHLNVAPTSMYAPSDSLDSDEVDDFGMIDGMGAIEGARIDSNLYDVYSNTAPPRMYPPPPLSTARPDDHTPGYQYEPPSIPGRQLPVPHNGFGVPLVSRRWVSAFSSGEGNGNNGASATSLTRQPSIRRSINQRVRLQNTASQAASDFSEFAARRRNERRQRHASHEANNAESSQTAGNLTSRHAEGQPYLPTPLSDLPRATLFDPPSPSTRNTGTRYSSPSSSSEGGDTESGRILRAAHSHVNTFLQTARGENMIPSDLLETWRTLPVPNAPRLPTRTPPLRRGGVQPPENILTATDTSLGSAGSLSSTRDLTLPSLLRPEVNDGGSSLNHGVRPTELGVNVDPWFPNVSRIPDEPASSASAVRRGVQDIPASLPTPRSESPAEGATRVHTTANNAPQ